MLKYILVGYIICLSMIFTFDTIFYILNKGSVLLDVNCAFLTQILIEPHNYDKIKTKTFIL